jgi:methionyl-tRNA formyltransferase
MRPAKLTAPEAMNQLRLWSPDLIVVAAFGQILRTEVLALPRHGCINVHASLLPRWRGAAPIQAAILAGDSETGVTIMKMDQGVDTGGILAQARIPIALEDTGGSLSKKLSSLGADLLMKTLPRYLSGELLPRPQDETLATHAPMMRKEDGLLDFAHPADELVRQVRAHNPWPGAFFDLNGNPFKVHVAHGEVGDALVGQTVILHGQPAIGTGAGLLVLDLIQPAGKKPMSGEAFLAGDRAWSS